VARSSAWATTSAKPGRGGKRARPAPAGVDVTLDELADILGEELELPTSARKGRRTSRRGDPLLRHLTTGPESMRHFRRTYREALKRQIAAGEYIPPAR